MTLSDAPAVRASASRSPVSFRQSWCLRGLRDQRHVAGSRHAEALHSNSCPRIEPNHIAWRRKRQRLLKSTIKRPIGRRVARLDGLRGLDENRLGQTQLDRSKPFSSRLRLHRAAASGDIIQAIACCSRDGLNVGPPICCNGSPADFASASQSAVSTDESTMSSGPVTPGS